jgi:uncharacterized protein YgiM (DUF1202 family)
MKRFLMVLLLVVFVLGAALPAFAQATPVASINTGSLNVRTGPGMQYGSIATLPFGFGVNMVARNSQGNWILIALTNGVTGWVNVQFLFTQFPTNSLPVSDAPVAATVTPTATVTGALSLNLRNGPSTDNAVIATVPLGTQVVLLGRSYDSLWAEVKLSNGTVGWVQASTLDGTVPVRSLSLADGSVFVPFAPDLPGTPGGNTGTGNTAGGSSHFYTVLPGDSLSAIAQHFGVSMYAIAAANHIWNYNLIYVDQQLIIPA